MELHVHRQKPGHRHAAIARAEEIVDVEQIAPPGASACSCFSAMHRIHRTSLAQVRRQRDVDRQNDRIQEGVSIHASFVSTCSISSVPLPQIPIDIMIDQKFPERESFVFGSRSKKGDCGQQSTRARTEINPSVVRRSHMHVPQDEE